VLLLRLQFEFPQCGINKGNIYILLIDLSLACLQDLQEQVEWMRQEEEAIQQAEEDARLQMQELRKQQREERDARRKADLEKKKAVRE
jgi:hypothetical protein